jgi:hypothetical protein
MALQSAESPIPMTNSVFTLLIALAVVILIVFLLRRRSVRGSEEWPFYARKLLSVPEQVLYHRLVKSLPECVVLAQVQVSRLIGVKKGYDFHQWHDRINRLSVDYVVCKKDLTIIAAIELDDSSHKKLYRWEADQRKESVFRAASVPLVRWSVKALPDESAIRAALALESQPMMAVAEDPLGRAEPFIGTGSDDQRRFFVE